MRSFLLLCAVVVALVASLAATPLLIQPPSVRAASEPGQFDAVRAKARLAAILGNERSHPADSFGDDAVRARLIVQIRALGLNPIIRDQFACNELYKQRGVMCARVRNVIVALGPAGGKALLLNAHYDSNGSGPGAGDDGVGVATLLEVASILKNKPLKRPLIFLFNEGEELGLLGARAFMADPLSGRVDSLINLEARGTTGPVTMFETNLPDGPPVRAFARAADRPFANSLTTDFYRQLPNYTDVNSFSERGWLALNFAMIGNETRYHSAGDNLAALDPRSLQHMGDQTLGVARELSTGRPGGGGTLLFADIAGRQLVMVPQAAGFALFVMLVFAFGFVSVREGGTWRGLALVLAGFVASAAIAWAAIWLLGFIRAGSFWRAWPVWTQLTAYSCGLLGAAGAIALFGRTLTIEQLRRAYWLAFLLLGIVVLDLAPGGVIFFLFPPLVALIGIVAGRWLSWARRAGAIAGALLLWLTLGEVLALLGQLMVNGPFFAFAPLALLIAMPWLIEAKALVDEAGRSRAIAAPALILLAALGSAFAAPAYSADRQQRFAIQHVSNLADGKASWLVTNDGASLPDRFGGIDGWQRDEFPLIERTGWIAPAQAIEGVGAPRLELLKSVRRGNQRTVFYRIRSNGAEAVTLIGEKDSRILSAGSDGFVRPIPRDTKGRYTLGCFGRSCDGAVMELTAAAPEPLPFILVGSNRSLPAAAAPLLADRPANARPQYSPDSTLTISQVRL